MSEPRMDLIDIPKEKEAELRGVAFATQGDQDEVEEQDAGDEGPISQGEVSHEGR